jgi:uncharacterized protein (DUF952 family)
MPSVRFLYHVMPASDPLLDPYSPPSLRQEGFVHCSYLPSLRESARLYFAAGAELRVLEIDPRMLDCDVRVVDTPRGPMPHVHGVIPHDAIVRAFPLNQDIR